jgi:asparagine synthase (glutamine-hydrolysing)
VEASGATNSCFGDELMCGIAGYVGWDRGRHASESDLRRMCDAIRHRGPDGEGHFVAPGVALGMRRLSVIDPVGGNQPIGNEDGSVQVVFNGEIYNYRELRGRLVAAGHRLTTHSDTETLVHLYEDEGDKLVHALRGMFAFAIWDTRRQRLLLARDRLGIKPLYYWERPGGLAFASELRALLALEMFSARLDRSALGEYLALGYVPEPQCIFEGVKKLCPGHILSWDRERGSQAVRYWSPVRPETPKVDEQEAIEELRRLLTDAVGCHLEADVPLGAFLSGGVDSSSVVALMGRQIDRPVRTFSIGFEEPAFNEAPDADAAARALGTEHRELIVRPDADALVEDVVRFFDEPFADSSALPTYLVAQLAREDVTVALSGDGGDELFGGYTRYTELLGRRELRPTGLRRVLRHLARRLPHASPGRNRLLDVARTRRGRYAATVAGPLAVRDGGVALPAVERDGGALESLLDRWFDQLAGRDFATQMMLVDTMSYLPGDILTKVDRMTMAVSLEARVPLLDHRLVEFVVGLPSNLKIRHGTGKWILRQAVAPLVPPGVLEKPKQGFGVPLNRWFRKELRHRVEQLQRADSPIYEFVDRDAVRRVAAEHRMRRRDYSHMLWRLLVLDLWMGCLARGELARPSEGVPMFRTRVPLASSDGG